eukprot:1480703-Amphidinium_carterae.1
MNDSFTRQFDACVLVVEAQCLGLVPDHLHSRLLNRDCSVQGTKLQVEATSAVSALIMQFRAATS